MQQKLNSVSLAYEIEGSGDVLVLLHGWGVDRSNFTDLAAALSKKYAVVSIDLPGFGESTKPDTAWGVQDYAECIQQFLEVNNLAQVKAIIGHSFGGRVAIKAVSHHLINPEKLVLIGSAGIKHSNSYRNMAYAFVAKAGKAAFLLPGVKTFRQRARTKLYERAGSSDYLNAGDMSQIFLKTINEDLSADAAGITTPTLLIWGSEDREAPLADARIFHRIITTSVLKIIQGAGHFVHNEHPRKVEKWIESFLQ